MLLIIHSTETTWIVVALSQLLFLSFWWQTVKEFKIKLLWQFKNQTSFLRPEWQMSFRTGPFSLWKLISSCVWIQANYNIPRSFLVFGFLHMQILGTWDGSKLFLNFHEERKHSVCHGLSQPHRDDPRHKSVHRDKELHVCSQAQAHRNNGLKTRAWLVSESTNWPFRFYLIKVISIIFY